jgi:uncharacterized protein (DUF885 family)
MTRLPIRLVRTAGIALVAGVLAIACSSQSGESIATASGEAESLDALVDDYWRRYLELNPLTASAIGDHRFDDRLANSLSERWLADSLALEQESLERAQAIDGDGLAADDALTRAIFIYGRELAVAGTRYPEELLPLHQMGSMPVYFARLGSGAGPHPFATTRDYDNFLARIDAFVEYCDQAIANMRLGITKGIVQPRIIVEKTIPQIAALAVDDAAESVFYESVADFPDAIGPADRARLEAAYRSAIEQKLLPAYARLADFLTKEYLPAARGTIGMAALPNGMAWYRYLVRQYTTTDETPEALHARGLAEVARIRAEMEAIRESVGFKGELPEFIAHLTQAPEFRFESADAMLEAYRALRDDVDARVPALFALMPSTDFEVRAVEPYREASASPASYAPGAPDGSRPAIFYVNTYDPGSRLTYLIDDIYLHEAVPGHHFQVALQQERQSLPDFRRYLEFTAYTEGWGLYAETLGTELGRYADPYSRFGALSAESLRAARIVADTGIHALGWTRAEAIAYLQANTAIGTDEIETEVDRYIALPGQALAYKTGQITLSGLRRAAEQRLGGNFDLRAFHAAVLEDGSMPLAILEEKMNRWLEDAAADVDAAPPARDAPESLDEPQPSASS